MKIALSTVEYTYSNDEPVVHLFGRDNKRHRHHVRVYNLFPFFYVPLEAPIPKNSRVLNVVDMTKKGWRSIEGRKVKKIIMKLPTDVGGNRSDKEGFRVRFNKTYEDDIEFITRATLELGIKSGFEIDIDDPDAPETPDYEFGSPYLKPCDFKGDLRRLHLDIEVSVRETGGRFPNILDPINSITSISCFDNYSRKFITFVWKGGLENEKRYLKRYKVPFEAQKYGFKDEYPLSIWTFNNEKDMLRKFINYVRYYNPDILAGWNAKKFDIPYILGRLRLLKLNAIDLSPIRSAYVNDKGIGRIKGRIIFDTWQGYKKTLTSEGESTKLGVVAEKIFGVGKVEHSGIDNMYKEDLSKFITYNVQDVFLEYAIGENQGIFNFFYDVKCYSGCHYEDVTSNGRIVDAYMLFKAKERKIIMPSKRDNEDRRSKGAIVLQAPRTGIQEWVCVLDLKSLYPMCMMTLNMGEDTIVYDPPKEKIPQLIKSPIRNVYFRKDKKSVLSEIINELIEYRDEMKNKRKYYRQIGDKKQEELFDRIQTVVKFITNSLFGVFGNGNFRAYNRKIFGNITSVGRMVLQHTIRTCEKMGFTIYYGDTDSIFPTLRAKNAEEAKRKMDKLSVKLNQVYEVFKKTFNTEEHYFKMKGEKIYKTLFMVRLKGGDRVAKKRYAGRVVWEDEPCDKLDIKGFDRSDMSRVGNRLMKDLLKMACYSDDPLEDAKLLVRKEINLIKSGHYELIDIGESKGISNPLSAYGGINKNGKRKGVPAFVRAAKWTNAHSPLWGAPTNYGAGSKPKYVWIYPNKMPSGYARTEIVSLDDNFDLPNKIRKIIDYNTLIEKTIKYKIETILEAIGTSWDVITSKTKAVSVLKFMEVER